MKLLIDCKFYLHYAVPYSLLTLNTVNPINTKVSITSLSECENRKKIYTCQLLSETCSMLI